MNYTSRISPYWLSAFSGVLLALSYPPFNLGFLAWFAWLPLWIALEEAGWQHGFRLGYLTGLVFTLGTLNWIANNSGTSWWIAWLSMLGAAAYMALYPGLFGLLLARSGLKLGRRAIWLAPFFWTSLEYLFSYHKSALGFPWLSLAMSQNLFLPVLQIAEWGGIYLISFWVVLINTLIYQIEFDFRRPRQQLLGWLGVALMLIVTFVTGWWRIRYFNQQSFPTLRVGLIQTNEDPLEKWDYSRKTAQVIQLLQTSGKLARQGAKIIVWPETAVPAHLAYYPRYLKLIRNFVDSHRVSILTGALHHVRHADGYNFYNSAFFFRPDSTEPEIYSKRRLVPFAERIPLSDRFPMLKALNFGQANFEPGAESLVVPMGSDSLKVPMGVVICYESADPYFFRDFLSKGAKIMSIITNDGWLGRSEGPYQHFAAGRMRAIENRISVIRVAQTGISAIFLPSGEIPVQLDLNRRGTIVFDLPLNPRPSFYQKYGDVWALLVVGITSLLLIAVFFWPAKGARNGRRS